MIGISVVFGEEFLELFCRLTLKCLTTKNNLTSPCCCIKNWIIRTTETGKNKILKSEYVSKVHCNTNIEFQIMDENIIQENKYKYMTDGHNIAIQKALEENKGVVFIQPDAMYFDGIFDYISEKKDFAGLFVPSFMVKREQFLRLFCENNHNTDLCSIRDACFEHLHQFTLDHNITSQTFRNDCPSFLMKKNGEYCYIFRPMPHGLIYLNPKLLQKTSISTTYDSDLLENFNENPELAFYETDCSKFLWPEMSPERRFSERVSNEPINFCWILHAWRSEKHFGGIQLKRKFLSLNFALYKSSAKKPLQDTSFNNLKIITDIIFFSLKRNLIIKTANIIAFPKTRLRRIVNKLFLNITYSDKMLCLKQKSFMCFLYFISKFQKNH